MKIHQTANGAKVNVVCNHPDDGSRYYMFVIEIDGEELMYMSTERFNARVRKLVEEEVNPYHYWHSIDITLTYAINGRITEVVI